MRVKNRHPLSHPALVDVLATGRTTERSVSSSGVEREMPHRGLKAAHTSLRVLLAGSILVLALLFVYAMAATIAIMLYMELPRVAFEAHGASIDWVFENLAVDRIVHTIKPDNTASQSVAKRLGATIEGQAEVFGNILDLWVTTREGWRDRA